MDGLRQRKNRQKPVQNNPNNKAEIEKAESLVTKIIEEYIKKYSNNPVNIIIVIIAIAIGTHYLVHHLGLVTASRALNSNKKAIHSAVRHIPLVGSVLGPINYYLNLMIKKIGVFAQPSIIISFRRFMKSIGTEGFFQALKELEIALRSVATTGTGAYLYAALFGRHGVYATSPFDPSGHALLGQLNVLNMTEVDSRDNLETLIKNVWSTAYLISAATTIVFYHTVPEYLVGLLFAYAGYYTWGYIYKFTFNKLIKMFPENETIVDIKRGIDKKLKNKVKTAGGSQVYNYIVNPLTNRKVNINGKKGKEILQNYLNNITN